MIGLVITKNRRRILPETLNDCYDFSVFVDNRSALAVSSLRCSCVPIGPLGDGPNSHYARR